MDFLSPEHLVVLAATVAACVGLGPGGASRPRAPAGSRRRRAGLAVLLVLNEVAFHVVHQVDEGLSARGDLPLHLTDAATIAAVIALWRPSPLAFELTYFWALTATVQALLTPDLRQGFPDYRWWWFFVAHCGVVVAAVFLAWGLRRTPRPGRGAARLRLEPRGDRAGGGRHARVRRQLHVPARAARGRAACST